MDVFTEKRKVHEDMYLHKLADFRLFQKMGVGKYYGTNRVKETRFFKRRRRCLEQETV